MALGRIVRLRVGLAAIGALLAAGCGTGDGPPIDPGDVTVEVRVQAMEAVKARLEDLPANPTSAQVLAAAVKAIADQPGFEAKGSSAELGMAWGRFPGGATYVVDANGRPRFGPPPSVAKTRSAMLQAASERTGIPAGPALLYQVLDPGVHANVAAQVIPWLLEAGYSVTVNPEAGGSVEDLKQVNGPAFFYMGTHGVYADVPDGAQSLWTAQTSTEPTAEAQGVYAEDLADQSLVMMESLVGQQWTRRFGFSGRFVRKYMRFAPNSLVFMDACSSDSPDTTEFKDACFEVGASLYAGWTHIVTDDACARSSPFLISRMLSAPAPDGEDEGTPRRPFDYGDAFAELRLRGWHVDKLLHPDWPEGQAELTITEGPGSGGWLRPSIECLRVDEYPTGASSGQSELVIRGAFGNDPGTGPFHASRSVRCDGEELSIVSWSADEIHATLPVHGPGSAGDVIVTAQGIKSNSVPLTEWWVTLAYRVGAAAGSGSTAFTEFSIDSHLRYDIHGWRETPTGSLKFALTEADDPPTHFAANSFGSFKCGGDQTFYDAVTGNFIYKIIYGGTGSLPYFASGIGNGCWGSTRLRYEYVGTTPTEGGVKPVLFIDGVVFAEGFPLESYFLWPDGRISNEEQRRVALNEFSNGSIVISQGQEFRLVIGEDGVIEAGESGNLSWQRALPRYQPTNVTAR